MHIPAKPPPLSVAGNNSPTCIHCLPLWTANISEDLLRRVDTDRSGIQGQQNAERHPVDEYLARKGDCCLVVRDAYRWAERRSCVRRSVTKLCTQDLFGTYSLSSARPIRGGGPRPARVGAVPTALRLRRLTSTSSPLPSIRARVCMAKMECAQ
ncbi:hypothetical protein PI125_g10819 [Phytophthora idaei]|nr:hypothetical protein PI125_g10819 [Phytophthora idaei]